MSALRHSDRMDVEEQRAALDADVPHRVQPVPPGNRIAEGGDNGLILHHVNGPSVDRDVVCPPEASKGSGPPSVNPGWICPNAGPLHTPHRPGGMTSRTLNLATCSKTWPRSWSEANSSSI